MVIPNIWKNNIYVPNDQADGGCIYIYISLYHIISPSYPHKHHDPWVEYGLNITVPSGKRACKKELENHHAINGKTHYFNGHGFKFANWNKLPEGTYNINHH